MWKELDIKEMETIDAGGPLEFWDGVVELFMDRLPDFFRGFAAGWNSK